MNVGIKDSGQGLLPFNVTVRSVITNNGQQVKDSC